LLTATIKSTSTENQELVYKLQLIKSATVIADLIDDSSLVYGFIQEKRLPKIDVSLEMST
ncbi:unnamed protein product, partial [Didymodactylos carnosus]